MTVPLKNPPITVVRYPATQQNNLQAWNAADELIIKFSQELFDKTSQISIFHDRFGYLNCHLADYKIQNVIVFHSQMLALTENINRNKLNAENITNFFPLDRLKKESDLVIMKMPKSVDLLEVYLQQLIPSLKAESKVIIGFMTRHFSTKAWQVVSEYFDESIQTKATKKARLMILSRPKSFAKKELIHQIKLDKNLVLKQYYGVFSAQKIDYATQFLMENLIVKDNENKIMDLGCGNGIIALFVHQQNPQAELHLTDDHYLAIESAKLNLGTSSKTASYYFTSDLNIFEENSFDLVVSNPPFHFEFENNIEISLQLFKQTFHVLKNGGRFFMVSNKHLNYSTHLQRIFPKVNLVAENNKFWIFEALKY